MKNSDKLLKGIFKKLPETDEIEAPPIIDVITDIMNQRASEGLASKYLYIHPVDELELMTMPMTIPRESIGGIREVLGMRVYVSAYLPQGRPLIFGERGKDAVFQ